MELFVDTCIHISSSKCFQKHCKRSRTYFVFQNSSSVSEKRNPTVIIIISACDNKPSLDWCNWLVLTSWSKISSFPYIVRLIFASKVVGNWPISDFLDRSIDSSSSILSDIEFTFKWVDAIVEDLITFILVLGALGGICLMMLFGYRANTVASPWFS